MSAEELLQSLIRLAEAVKKNPIEKLEEEINERVYKLYGLDEEDKKVIEEFLERF